LPPFFGPNLIRDEQYVASPWTRSKVEPHPEWADQGSRSERPDAGIPFGYGTSPALGHDHGTRRLRRPPRDAVHRDRDDREQFERHGPPDESERRKEQRVQQHPPHAQNACNTGSGSSKTASNAAISASVNLAWRRSKKSRRSESSSRMPRRQRQRSRAALASINKPSCDPRSAECERALPRASEHMDVRRRAPGTVFRRLSGGLSHARRFAAWPR
jgi:hypothetical protein